MIKEILLSSALIFSPIEINYKNKFESDLDSFKKYERSSLYDLVIKQPILAIKEEDDFLLYFKKGIKMKKYKSSFDTDKKYKTMNNFRKSELHKKIIN